MGGFSISRKPLDMGVGFCALVSGINFACVHRAGVSSLRLGEVQ